MEVVLLRGISASGCLFPGFRSSYFFLSVATLFLKKALLLLLVFSIKLTTCPNYISLPAKGERMITVLGISPAVSYHPELQLLKRF